MKDKDCCFTDDKRWFRYRAGALIIEDGCILFAGNRTSEYLYTVGGGVHMNEKAEDCVRREVLEETGVDYEIDHLAVICENFFKGDFGNFVDFDCHCLELYFVMKSKGKKDVICRSTNADGEQEFLRWVPISEIKHTNIKPSFLKERITEIVESGSILHIVTDADR